MISFKISKPLDQKCEGIFWNSNDLFWILRTWPQYALTRLNWIIFGVSALIKNKFQSHNIFVREQFHVLHILKMDKCTGFTFYEMVKKRSIQARCYVNVKVVHVRQSSYEHWSKKKKFRDPDYFSTFLYFY